MHYKVYRYIKQLDCVWSLEPTHFYFPPSHIQNLHKRTPSCCMRVSYAIIWKLHRLHCLICEELQTTSVLFFLNTCLLNYYLVLIKLEEFCKHGPFLATLLPPSRMLWANKLPLTLLRRKEIIVGIVIRDIKQLLWENCTTNIIETIHKHVFAITFAKLRIDFRQCKSSSSTWSFTKNL